ncbi:tail fiber domain-containing protein [Pseudomonas sp. NY15463]|uniref:tail fiber domain-containing protein n=1 Tax=Pseudomonas sp. NY15463 TaxID=3400361 RepID=UPI003A8A96DA
MPWYRQGAVAITAGQTTVVGAGVDFALNSRVGDAFQGPDGRWYEVANIASSTVLSILPAYQGATVTAGAYGLAPMQGYVKESADRLRQLVDQFGAVGQFQSLNLTSTSDVLIMGGVPHTPVAIGPVISIAKNENMVAEFISASSTSAWGGRFNFLRSRGTTAEPTPPSIDDTVGGIQFVPYHGSGYGAGAYILGIVDEAAVPGSVVPTRMLFRGKAVYAGTMGAVTQASYCAEFQGSGSVTNGNRLIFSQNSTYAAAMAANSTGGTSGRMTFQWITRADGTLQSTPMEMNFDGSVAFGGVVRPRTDNSFTLGNSALRWSTVYAGTGTINTSDARDKTVVRGLTEAELAAAKDLSREIGAYKFLASVAEKGDDAREHIGMTVQRAVEIMASHGLDPFGYSFICFDEWEDTVIEHPAQYEQVATPALLDEEGREIEPGGFVDGALVSEAYTEVVVPAGNKYSFRMDGLLAFIAAGLEARLTALEAA